MALSDNTPPLDIGGSEHPSHGTGEVTAVKLSLVNSALAPLGLANLLGLAGLRAVVLGGLRRGCASGGRAGDAIGGSGGCRGTARGASRGSWGRRVVDGSIGVAHESSNGRTREGVLAGTEEVTSDAWVACTVGTRVRDELSLGGPSSAAAANAELSTAWVEFSAGVVGGRLRSDMESDDLMADEVVAGCDVGGEGDAVGGTVHEVLLEPFTTVRLTADLVNLEPLSVPGVELAAGPITTVRKVGDHGTSVVRPVAAAITTFPVKANGVAWVDIENTGCILGAHTTVVGWVVDAVDRLKVGHLANGTGVAVAVPGTVRRRGPVAGLISCIDRSKITVRRNVGCEEKGDESNGGRAHCSRSVSWIKGGRRIRGGLSEWNVQGLVCGA